MKNSSAGRSSIIARFIMVLGGFAGGCDESVQDYPRMASSKPAEIPAIVLDAGDVAVDSGAAMVEREFLVTNESAATVDLQCKTSCGCLGAVLSTKRLEPGESTNLRLTVKVSNAGRRAESAWIMRSDGQVHTFVIKTNGTIESEFHTFKVQSNVPPDGQCCVRAYLIDSRGDGVAEAPILVGPEGLRIVSSGWNTLERRDGQGNRPTRQVGTLVVDFAGFTGTYPVELRFRTKLGSESTVVLEGPLVG